MLGVQYKIPGRVVVCQIGVTNQERKTTEGPMFILLDGHSSFLPFFREIGRSKSFALLHTSVASFWELYRGSRSNLLGIPQPLTLTSTGNPFVSVSNFFFFLLQLEANPFSFVPSFDLFSLPTLTSLR
jgi:hypothetical protein